MTADPRRVRVGRPPAEHAPGLAEELARRGYTSERAARHLQLLAQLSRWLQGRGWPLDPHHGELVVRGKTVLGSPRPAPTGCAP